MATEILTPSVTSPLPPPDLPKRRPMAPGGLPRGLLIGLPILELRLQFRPELAVGPFFVALPPIEEHPLPDRMAPLLVRTGMTRSGSR